MTLICDRANTVPYSRQFSQSQPVAVTLYPTYSDFLAENCESLNTTSNLLEYERYFVLKKLGPSGGERISMIFLPDGLIRLLCSV